MRSNMALVTDDRGARLRSDRGLVLSTRDIEHFGGILAAVMSIFVARIAGETTRSNVLCTLLLGDITYTQGPTTTCPLLL